MEKSGFFNAMKIGDTWDRVYKAENFAEYFATFIGNGVFPNPANQLQVKETDKMQVILKAGKAWINGFIYINTEDLVLDVDVADGVLNRIDKVVLRYDVAKREIRAAIKKGEFNSKPTAPILTRNADMYELALADITISAGAIKISQADITDLRLNKEMCGIVHGIVEQVDTTAIFNQFESWYSTTKDNYDKDISTWTKEKKEAFKEWYSTNTQAFLKQFQTWFKNTEAWEKDFKKWFESIKNILDTNAAGNLLNLINKNTDKIDSIEKNVQSTLEENNKETDKKVQELNSQYEDVMNNIGDKKDLKTSNKDNMVEAINEVFTLGNNVKERTVNALLQVDNSLQLKKEDNWDDITKNISKISTEDEWDVDDLAKGFNSLYIEDFVNARVKKIMGNYYVRYTNKSKTPSSFFAVIDPQTLKIKNFLETYGGTTAENKTVICIKGFVYCSYYIGREKHCDKLRGDTLEKIYTKNYLGRAEYYFSYYCISYFKDKTFIVSPDGGSRNWFYITLLGDDLKPIIEKNINMGDIQYGSYLTHYMCINRKTKIITVYIIKNYERERYIRCYNFDLQLNLISKSEEEPLK